MTHSVDLESKLIPLKELALHPMNARANNPNAYTGEDIPILAASIAAIGIINPLIVQVLENGDWGVLAGGRRLAALKTLQKDKSAKDWKTTSEIPCRVIDGSLELAAALTLAENVTQQPMDPIDQFEAFAAMMEAGSSVSNIAKTFGITERSVGERLRYGRVHPDIRSAARKSHHEDGISLDELKAYANHPDQEVQIAVFNDLAAGDAYVNAYTIRNALGKRGVKLSDPKAALVRDAYEARGGSITADLIEEDSVLDDPTLVDNLLAETLAEIAEATRAEHGFAWCDVMTSHDWQEFQRYGRVYPSTIEPEGKDGERAAEIADRLAAIEEAMEDESVSDDGYDDLETEHDRLQQELDDLTTAWAEDDLARSGVMISWQNGTITTTFGLVRKEDEIAPTSDGKAESGGTGGAEDAETETRLKLADSHITDLRVEQALAVGAALAESPALAHDLLLFKIASDMFSHGSACFEIKITASQGNRVHSRRDAIDPTADETIQSVIDKLDLSWSDKKSPPEQFEAFRTLKPAMKSSIIAAAMAHTVEPASYGTFSKQLITQIAQEVLPNIRDMWRPTGDAFFARIKKADLINILATDLGMPEEAGRLMASKKADIVTFMETLFAEGFATMTDAQRRLVAAWCPPGMEIPAREENARKAPAAEETVEAEAA